MKKFILTAAMLIAALLIGCEQENEILETKTQANVGTRSHYLATTSSLSVSISNAGFESDWSGWSDTDPSSISGDAYSGTKSAKLSGAGGKLEQTVTVSANTDYELSAYVKGSWRIGANINGTRKTRSGSTSSWKQETVSFNSGSATSITILAEYNSAEGRFDDFTLTSTGSGGSSSAPIGKTIWLKADNNKYVVAERDITDNPLEADRGSVGAWEKFLVVDAGDGLVALQANMNSKYVVAEKNTTNNPVRANRTSIGAWEKFTWEAQGNNQVALKANANGKYIKSQIGTGDNPLRATASSVESSATFTWGEVGGTTTPPNNGGGGTDDKPTDIIPSLTDWKITLPVDSNGNDSAGASNVDSRNKNAHEIKDNNLIDYEYSPYFEVRDGEVVFRAHCAGATTSGSKYPRCELRQRVGGGDNYWSVNDYQKLVTELRVTHLPVKKPEVSMVQIHGPNDEPLRVQYHASNGLYIVWNETNKDYFKSDVPYTLGQQLKVTVVVNNGDITCTVLNMDTNKSYTKTWTSNDSTGYFKVGCYTQSSVFLSEFKSGYDDEPADAYGEITVSSIDLTETY